MTDVTWLPYLIVAILIAVAALFTFRRVPRDANNDTRPPEPRR